MQVGTSWQWTLPAHGWLLCLLIAHGVLSVSSLVQKSVTIDEFGHLPAGVLLLETGDRSFASLNPPLMPWLAALPTRLVAPSGDANPVAPGAERLARTIANPFWRAGYRFMADRGADYQRLFVAARLVSVAVVMLLAVVVYAWARELAPQRPAFAGLLAAGLVLFSPNVLAHGRLVTTDAGAAAAMTLALYAAWRFVQRPGTSRAVALGVAFGLAQLVKFTAVLLVVVLATQFVLAWYRAGPAARCAIARGALVGAAVALGVVHAGYGFQHPFPALSDFDLHSQRLTALLGWLPDGVRLPVPGDYLAALDRQLRALEAGDASFLLGQSYHGGRWDYFLVLLATKIPIGVWLLSCGLVFEQLRGRWRQDADVLAVLGGPALLLFAVGSFAAQKQIGLRMILPVLPLWFCGLAVLAARSRAGPWRDRAVVAAAVLAAAASLRAHPDYLPYYNVIAGGSEAGHRVALQSNYDWGQDLIALRERLDTLGAGPVQLLYYGRVDPAIYGIDYVVPDANAVRPGLLAVSRSFEARSYFLYDHGELRRAKRLVIDADRIGEDIGNVGHSIRLFRVAPPPASVPNEAHSGNEG